MRGSINIPIEEFIKPFFDAHETVCIRVFDDRRQGTFRGAKLECKAGKIDAMTGALHKHNELNRGIYFVVNHGGHEDTDIKRVNAHFVECDDLTIEEQLTQIEAFPIEPSIIVRTKKSLHTYWLMKESEVTNFRRVQKKLAAHFNGDSVCINESRVLRLPGFNHCKGEPFPVSVVKFNPELRYTQKELEAVLPTLPDEQAPSTTVTTAPPKGARKGITIVGKQCMFIQHCKDNAKTLPEHDWYAMISNLAVFEDGDRIIHLLSKDYPGYSQSETQRKIEHFLESGTKPMTCHNIAEKGFKCPKLEDGSCGCKAPAALCYKPLPPDGVRSILATCVIKDNVTDNMQTAKTFISDYMYNADPVLADSLIRYEIKDHFKLNTESSKTLLKHYKQLYRTYADATDTRRAAFDDELPPWYAPTERGGLRFMPGILANHMAENAEAFYGAGSFFFYDNGVYKRDDDIAAHALVRGLMSDKYAKMSDISDTTAQWRMLVRKPVREINSNAFVINTRNGLYNVLDGNFKAHSSEYYSTVQINAKYEPGAECPQFQTFLHSILSDEDIKLVQEIFGYLLIPVNKAQKAFVFVGAANAGKSTLLSIAQEILLGADNVSNVPWQGLGERFNKAELFGKMANIFADLPSKSVDDNGMFKALTGEDYITAERKNKDPFSFRPYARLLFSCNEIPRNYGDRSDGFYRRLIIIRFDRSVPVNERDPNLREKLSVERDGIFMWALEGLRRLMDNSYVFTETESTRNELQRYRIDSNSALLFAEECCTLDSDMTVMREDLFNRYREYCIKNGLKSMSQTNFNKDIESMGVERGLEKVSRRSMWKGIRYNDE